MVDPRVYNEAKALVDAGYEVSVIVWDRKKNYRKEETVDGIQLFRIHNTGLMKALSHDLLRNPLWWWKAYKKGIELYNDGFDFDVVHCHDLDTLTTGVLLKKKLSVKLVYDAHEVFGYMIEKNMPNMIVLFSFIMEKKLLNIVDQIITADVGYKQFFEKISEKPITIVRNCKNIITETYIPPSKKKFSVVYIGTLSKSRFFPELLTYFSNIKDVDFIVAGKTEGLYEDVASLSKSIQNVIFLGTIPFKQVVPLTLECHVVLCLFDASNRLNQIGSPNKLFEAMVCGRPVIASKGTYSGKLVEELQMGLSIDFSQNNLKGVIEKLRDTPELCERFGRNALKAGLSEFNWPNQEKNLVHLYNELNDK
jgi:glycosyltransferase involved in cell wall biosynthesis